MNTHTRIYAILHGIRKAGGQPHKEKDNRMDQRAENELQHPPCKKTQMTHQSNLPNGLLLKKKSISWKDTEKDRNALEQTIGGLLQGIA